LFPYERCFAWVEESAVHVDAPVEQMGLVEFVWLPGPIFLGLEHVLGFSRSGVVEHVFGSGVQVVCWLECGIHCGKAVHRAVHFRAVELRVLLCFRVEFDNVRKLIILLFTLSIFLILFVSIVFIWVDLGFELVDRLISLSLILMVIEVVFLLPVSAMTILGVFFFFFFVRVH